MLTWLMKHTDVNPNLKNPKYIAYEDSAFEVAEANGLKEKKYIMGFYIKPRY